MATFEEGIQLLVDFGLYDVVLPFILVFTIVFAILEKINMFGEQKKNINAMIAFVFGFITVSTLKYVNAINNLMSNTALIMVGGVLVLIILGSLGLQNVTENNFIKWSAISIGIVGVLVILGNWFNIWEGLRIPWQAIKGVSGFILIAAFFLLIIWWIVRDKPKDNNSSNTINNQEETE
jgi:hypothetical protein